MDGLVTLRWLALLLRYCSCRRGMLVELASTQIQEYQAKNEFTVIMQAEAMALFSRAHPCTEALESQVMTEFRAIKAAEAKAVSSGVCQCMQIMQSQRQVLGNGTGTGFGKPRKKLRLLRRRVHRLSGILSRVVRYQRVMEQVQVYRLRLPFLFKRVSSLEVVMDMASLHRAS